MISFRALSTVSLLSLLVSVAACSATTESGGAAGTGTSDLSTAQDAVAADDSSPAQGDEGRGPRRGPHGHGGGGPDFLVFAALHEPINLTAEQKTTIESLAASNRPKGPPAFDKARAATLAAGIRAGKVDTTAIKAPGEEDFAARQAASAKTLQALHDALTATQRKDLVAAVAKRAEEHGAKEGPKGDHARGGRPGGDMGPMGFMLKDLNLTKEQEASIRGKLEAQRPKPSEADITAMKAQHEAGKAEMKAKLQTFANDSFDATAFVTPPASMKAHAPKGNPFAAEIAVITSVLDAGQREKLAAKIEAGPPAGMQRGGDFKK